MLGKGSSKVISFVLRLQNCNWHRLPVFARVHHRKKGKQSTLTWRSSTTRLIPPHLAPPHLAGGGRSSTRAGSAPHAGSPGGTCRPAARGGVPAERPGSPGTRRRSARPGAPQPRRPHRAPRRGTAPRIGGPLHRPGGHPGSPPR